MARSTPGLVLRKINIGSWNSPVARQYGIRRLPHLLLFDNGRLVAEGTDQVLAQLR